MASIYPFRAWRYNPAAVQLGDVLTQPDDRITPAMQQAYYQRSPYNLVRVVLGLTELFDAEPGQNVYTRAAHNFRTWRQRGILLQEKTPCIFAYTQQFQVPGSALVKEHRSFIALGKLHDYADHVVFRPELTRPAAKSDRLDLLRASRAQFGQILMLYSDPAQTVERILYDGNGAAETEVTDEYGVLHRLWRISDPAALRLLTTAMADKKLILGDGHQAYEAALAFRDEHAPVAPEKSESSVHQLPRPPYPEAAAMMTFVNLDSEGLVLLPTHRVVRGLPAFEPAIFAQSVQAFFTVESLPTAEIDSYLERLRAPSGAALIAITQDGALLLRVKPEPLGTLPHPTPTSPLTLHNLVLERLPGLNTSDLHAHSVCLHDPAEAVDQVRRGAAQLALLAAPATIEQLKEAAFAGDRMPEGSTAFYPSLLSGLAIYAFD